MGDASDCLHPRPPVPLRRAPVPVRDDIVQVAHEDRVVRQIEEARLLVGLRLHPPALEDLGLQPLVCEGEVTDPRRQVVVRLLQLRFRASLCPGDPGDEQSREREDEEVPRVVDRDGPEDPSRRHDEMIHGQEREAGGE